LLRSGLLDLQRRQREVAALLAEERKEAEDLATIEMRDEELHNEIVRQQQFLAAAIERVNNVRLAKDYGGFVTEVIAPVEVGKQVSPQPVLFLAVGTLLGTCLGATMGVVRDQTRRAFCSDADVRWTLGLPVLGHFRVRPTGRAVTHEKFSLDETLVAHQDPASREAETLRHLRAVILRPQHCHEM
jgi:hypothetical protein